MTTDEEEWRRRAESLLADGWFPMTVNAADCLALGRAETDERGRRQLTALLLVGDRIDASTFKRFPIGSINTGLNLHEMGYRSEAEMRPLVEAARNVLLQHLQSPPEPWDEDGRAPLTRPDGRDPDTFYRQVAQAYRSVAGSSRAVAPVLAEEAGVPVATVHRWVLEARRRGFLPPARRGRAG